jgi:putative transcriptional regulator
MTVKVPNHTHPNSRAYIITGPTSGIEKWETGAKHPSGMALKLLAVVEKHGLEELV